MSNSKDNLAQTQFNIENLILIEAKGQVHPEVMNVCNVSSNGEALICQI